LISIKKYLDADSTALVIDEPQLDELLAVTMESYRSALKAVGKSAIQACPAPGRDLERALKNLAGCLSNDALPEVVKHTEKLAEEHLQQWGSSTEEYLQAQANEVKELLLMLARTAESVGERDQRYAKQFSGLTTELKAIANLDDLTLIRSSLVRKAAEMKSCIDQMAHDGQQSLAHLRSKVSGYETKLKAVELLASRDTVTGLFNRRSVEGRMERYASEDQTFCVVMLDLNGFKQINDKYGHAAGDDVLGKFAQELLDNVRSDDIVGRWGGDEFVVVLSRDLARTELQVERIRKWVFGNYTLELGASKIEQKVQVDASIGLAEWQPGKTVKEVVEQADADMYLEKRAARKGK
jgi:diguanylate cyclase (GGDEF)-like protein